MGDQTFEQLWKKILVYAPSCPVPLAQEFVNTAYSRALGHHAWSGLRKSAEAYIPAAYTTGTVSVTNASATVTGSGTTWTSAMAGRQFFLSGREYYTVASVESSTSLTLDRVYGEETASAQTYTIQLVYVVVPSDFLSFESVVDLDQNYRLRLDFTQDHLDVWDAERSSSGSPLLLAPAPFSSSGLPRYEIWPRPSAALTLHYRYQKKPSLMSANSDTPIYPIRGDVLRWGALAELALWPGLADDRSPYADESRFRAYEKRFKEGLAQLEVEDNQILQQAVSYPDYSGLPYAPVGADFMQSHGIV